jgi:hypothetical protein
LVTQEKHDDIPEEEKEEILEQFRTALDVDDLSNVTIEELARILEPCNPIERMAFRHGSSTANVVLAKPFASLTDTRVETFS